MERSLITCTCLVALQVGLVPLTDPLVDFLNFKIKFTPSPKAKEKGPRRTFFCARPGGLPLRSASKGTALSALLPPPSCPVRGACWPHLLLCLLRAPLPTGSQTSSPSYLGSSSTTGKARGETVAVGGRSGCRLLKARPVLGSRSGRARRGTPSPRARRCPLRTQERRLVPGTHGRPRCRSTCSGLLNRPLISRPRRPPPCLPSRRNAHHSSSLGGTRGLGIRVGARGSCLHPLLLWPETGRLVGSCSVAPRPHPMGQPLEGAPRRRIFTRCRASRTPPYPPQGEDRQPGPQRPSPPRPCVTTWTCRP